MHSGGKQLTVYCSLPWHVDHRAIAAMMNKANYIGYHSGSLLGPGCVYSETWNEELHIGFSMHYTTWCP